MAAKRDRYTYTRGLSASLGSTTVHPLKKSKVSHSWNRKEEQSKKPSGPKSANNGSGEPISVLLPFERFSIQL